MKLLTGVTAIFLGASSLAGAATSENYSTETPSELKCQKSHDILQTAEQSDGNKTKSPLTSTLTSHLTDEYKKLNASCN
ncbi:hypothetical protein D3C76_1082320 [compost metagenome]|jgi:hypothetical protein